jgi:riboflavin synthase
MFTGLIQGVGLVEAVEAKAGQTRLRIRARFELAGLTLGESVAVSGVCLTVEAFQGGVFSVYASRETLARTTLGELKQGSRVNLERALALGDRLGGHLVSGHVDCLARVDSLRPAGESNIYRLGFPREFGPLVVEKGSVALDGISLTVNECGEDWLAVNIIPATQKETAILDWAPGRAVNMEADLIGKYVQRMLAPHLAGRKAAPGKEGVTRDFLEKHGF